MFIDIKEKITNPEILNILAACVFDNSDKGMAKKAEEYKQHEEWLFYGWQENEKIVGVCGYKVHPAKIEILSIATSTEAQGQGIGSRMIIALQEKYNLPLEAETDDDAIGFYKKRGFATTPFEKHGVRRWTCLLPVNI